MARGTILFELAFMGIEVAIQTMLELDALIPWRAVLAGRVTLGTGRREMFPGEREARLRMIECLLIELRALPGSRVVTLKTVRPKAAIVLVLVTSCASRTQPHPSTA